MVRSGDAVSAIRLHPNDDVAIVMRPLDAGLRVLDDVAALGPIPPGHKVALGPIAAGQQVRKSGHVIGVATRDIVAGEHVHTHNVANVTPTHGPTVPFEPPAARPNTTTRTFDGYRRADGRVGTRNHLLVLPTVNCSATVARAIAERVRPVLPAGVDGVWALSHQSGCGIPADGPQLARLRAVLRGYATHPNTAGVLLVGLGCEVNQLDDLADAVATQRVRTLEIQDAGGTAAAIGAGVVAIGELAETAAADRRTPAPIAELTLGLQCGGSDGFSALSANPALGGASDLLVAAGGAVLLSETPELIGAIDELAERAHDPTVAAQLRELAAWWTRHAADHGTTLDANPSPGNIAGGITTIVEKSIGAAAKGGTSAVTGVVAYAERPRTRGLVIMDSPGYDPASATGQIAAGAQVVCFTTGRGSCFGSVPAPALKLSTTSDLARRMPDDIDIDCGTVLTGEPTGAVAARILDEVVAVASGRRTCSERLGYGLDEFVPWTDGITL